MKSDDISEELDVERGLGIFLKGALRITSFALLAVIGGYCFGLGNARAQASNS